MIITNGTLLKNGNEQIIHRYQSQCYRDTVDQTQSSKPYFDEYINSCSHCRLAFPFLPACASCGFLTLTIGRISPGVEGDSEGLVPRVAAVGRVAWVDIEENATETQLRQQGELQDKYW